MAAATITELQELVKAFAIEREWEQFHSPKNLVMALTAEVGELVELFQWLSTAESSIVMQDTESGRRVTEEMADVFIYLLRLADVLKLDLGTAVEAKIQTNATKYPTDRARGSAKKYNQL